jgi:hypothetical protein
VGGRPLNYALDAMADWVRKFYLPLWFCLLGAWLVYLVYKKPLWIGIPLACLAGLWLVQSVRLRAKFRRLGWEAMPNGRDSILYRENSNGYDRCFELSGELLATGRIVYVPTSSEWNSEVPEWAADRRDEILGRIRESFRGRDYDFISRDGV